MRAAPTINKYRKKCSGSDGKTSRNEMPLLPFSLWMSRNKANALNDKTWMLILKFHLLNSHCSQRLKRIN